MKPTVTICGSYHRDPAGLLRIFRELESTGCRILSPLSINFTDNTSAIVKLNSEKDFTTEELEKFHLRAMRESDFIWLHNPGGYVGISASYELGYATALGKPIFAFIAPEDDMLASQVRLASSVFEALEAISFLNAG